MPKDLTYYFSYFQVRADSREDSPTNKLHSLFKLMDLTAIEHLLYHTLKYVYLDALGIAENTLFKRS